MSEPPMNDNAPSRVDQTQPTSPSSRSESRPPAPPINGQATPKQVPSPTAPEAAETAPEFAKAELSRTFVQLHKDTQHILTQTDRIAGHLLEGQTTAQRHMARTLVGQVEQLGRNQVLLIKLVEEILQRLPPVAAPPPPVPSQPKA